jgi:hypothetical protein
METVIGMLCAFLLGAFVRMPFELKQKERHQDAPPVDDTTQAWLKEQAELEAERNKQLFSALNWNGKAGEYED